LTYIALGVHQPRAPLEFIEAIISSSPVRVNPLQVFISSSKSFKLGENYNLKVFAVLQLYSF
jgi:hypothetical protein